MKHLTHLILPDLKQLVAEMDETAIRNAVGSFHPADIADILEHASDEDASQVFVALPLDMQVGAFGQMEEFEQLRLMERVGKSRMIKVIEEMASDDRVDVIQALPDRTVETLLPLLAQAERNNIKKLLGYEEGTAGAIMATEYASLPADITVREALDQLRKIAPDRETVYEIFVLDDERRLLGRLSLLSLVIAKPDQTVRELMTPPACFARAGDDQEEAARAIEKYDVLAIPTLDDEDRLVGIITHDDVIDVIEEEATEDAQMMGAVEPLDVPYFQESFWGLIRKRVVWLSLLFVGGMLTTTALEHYSDLLQTLAVITVFLPLIISAGGNSGSQSSVLIIRGLAVGSVTLNDWSRVALRECATGLVLGLLIAPLGIIRGMMLHTSLLMMAAIGLTLVMVITTGSLVGSSLPLLIKRLGFDPAVSSGPFVSVLVDVVGIVIYIRTVKTLIEIFGAVPAS